MISTAFEPSDYAASNLEPLCDSLHTALVDDGLYDKEATAMLNTWRSAYFKSPGLRVFALMPQAWTDQRMPIRISIPSTVRRVMVARIELISPEQRQLLDWLGKSAAADNSWLKKIGNSPAKQAFLAGRSNFGDLGVEIPADYHAYLQLGRFRNALLESALADHPAPGLKRFAAAYGFQPKARSLTE